MSQPLERGKRALDADATGESERDDLESKVARIQANIAMAGAIGQLTTARLDLIDGDVKMFEDDEQVDERTRSTRVAHDRPRTLAGTTARELQAALSPERGAAARPGRRDGSHEIPKK